jgi:hypothetical protein
MKWTSALQLARLCEDLTYEEWCNLYVNKLHPTEAQIEHALKTAHRVLVRNGVIEESVELSYA